MENLKDLYVVYLDEGDIYSLGDPEEDLVFPSKLQAIAYMHDRKNTNLKMATLKEYIKLSSERKDDIAQDAAWERE